MAGQPILVASWTMRAPACCRQSRAMRERIRIWMAHIESSMRLGSAAACLLAAAAGPARGAVKSVDRGKRSLKRGFFSGRYRRWTAFACDIVRGFGVDRANRPGEPGTTSPRGTSLLAGEAERARHHPGARVGLACPTRACDRHPRGVARCTTLSASNVPPSIRICFTNAARVNLLACGQASSSWSTSSRGVT